VRQRTGWSDSIERGHLRQRRHPPAVQRGVDELLGDGHDVGCGFAVFGHHRVQEHQVGDPFRDGVGDARDDHPRVAVPDEHDVALVLEQADDVVDVGAEPDLRAQQVGLVAVAGQGRREHPVSGGFQARDHPIPAASAVPSAVDQQEC
jgi:hypothetical protein